MSQIDSALTNAPPELLAFLGNTPAIPPPPGIVSNFLDPENHGAAQVKATSILLAVTLVFFLSRVYVKLFLTKKVTWDDGTIVLAVLSAVGYYVACTWGVQKGRVGTHLWNISILQASNPNLLIPSYLASVLTPPTFLFLKTSFFIFYLQIFDRIRWLRMAIWFGLVVNVLLNTFFTISSFIYATPKKGESLLSHQTSNGEVKLMRMSVPQSSIGLVLDLYILVVPILGVAGLKMSARRKTGLVLIFLSGFMACVCSACSIYYRVLLERDADVTWALIPVDICSLCEMFVGIICACIPAAVYAARQHNSTYHHIIGKARSMKITLFKPKNRLASQSSINHPSLPKECFPKNVLRSTDQKYAQYLNMDTLTAAGSLSNMNGVNTIVHSPKDRDSAIMTGPGIHRQFDIDIERC
ncbi:hypothetical protein HYFRA_00003668 [Hymenoscyphus fraxineus]|uniref:Rhodopsin domain-containing protein n=1 Tax=Hymenoscyphus fraxineus TaxID=746836 RepID=A0A9N9PV45_9HELO|nr:hypothetical protein HYFRA_00003668 [Hymenoscyphus fraxineus]